MSCILNVNYLSAKSIVRLDYIPQAVKINNILAKQKEREESYSYKIINTIIATAIAKHLIILTSINNIYKLEEASRVLLKELLRIADITVFRRKPNIRTTAL